MDCYVVATGKIYIINDLGVSGLESFGCAGCGWLKYSFSVSCGQDTDSMWLASVLLKGQRLNNANTEILASP